MPNLEQQLNSEFMLFGAHPNQGSPWPKPCVYTFRSPQFDAVPATGPFGGLFAWKGRIGKIGLPAVGLTFNSQSLRHLLLR
jgi:hypothetical protein